jgi:enoyl-CoA hydratase/carnithine racemase
MHDGAPVGVQHDGRVAILTLHNPPVNALSLATTAALEQALAAQASDPATRVIIITGAGDKIFAGGADIRELAAATTADHGLAITTRGQMMCNAVAKCPTPVIAAMNGAAYGGGLELALACHLRVCSDQARMGQTEINLGLMPGWGGTQRLARLVGPARALALILTGDRIDAVEAHSIGLVDRLVPPDRVLFEALELANRIAARSGPAIRAALRAVLEGLEMPLDAALRDEADHFIALMAGADAHEGLNAFLEKRPPTFTDD